MTTQIPSDLTPLMRQYYAMKQQCADALLFFQVGDFYELFFEDAKVASAFLGIALTKRGKVNGEPIPLCGVPVHALDHYISKLIKGGFKVALCDQLEEAKPGKVVERGIRQVFTPGTLTDSKLLDEKSASYLFSFFPADDQWGLIFAELLTAQLFATVLSTQSQKALESELIRFFPDEIVLPDQKNIKTFESYFKGLGYYTTILSNQSGDQQAYAWMQKQFQPQTFAYLDKNSSLRLALEHFYAYVNHTQQAALEQFKTVHWYAPDEFLILDQATQTNLELVRNNHDGSNKNTLFAVIDGALTPMGSRMIKKWIMRPLVKQEMIVQRQDVIQDFCTNTIVLQKIETVLTHLGDLERVIGRIALKRAGIQDYVHLKNGLTLLPTILVIIQELKGSGLMQAVTQSLAGFEALCKLLDAALVDELGSELIIKPGFDQELDYMREMAQQGAQKILALEQQEQQKTGINSLKIRYNDIQGYYIEVTKTHLDAIPAHYMRQQTLVGRERYMTAELQQLQQEIIRAQKEMGSYQNQVFDRIKSQVLAHTSSLRKLAHALANLDALIGLSRTAYAYGYVRPTFNKQQEIIIEDGRHPVVERILGHGFIPNNTMLAPAESTWIITGPNMGGKSTYLRQVALINIMAQLGSFVPVKGANLPILDRIFTRIGAGDNLAQGKSTFLVEMEETASICKHATEKSLVILDEVGRGTSTFDGLALARSVVEYIHTHIKARCLFATHYHELTTLPGQFQGIVTYYAASSKTVQGIQFLYKIIKGVADGSFGIEVAKLAHLPDSIIHRAYALLRQLEKEGVQISVNSVPAQQNHHELQAKLEQLQMALQKKEHQLAALQNLDYDNLSPKQALDFLWKMRELG